MDQSTIAQTLPAYKIAARGLAPEDNFVGWREALGLLFDIDLNGVGNASTFRADFASYFMGPMVLGTGDCTAQNYQRTGRTIARSGVDPFLIQLYTRGGFAGTADGQEIAVKAGDVCVLDMARNIDTFSPSSSNITLVVPRALLAPLVRDADALHGTVLDPRSAHGGIVADYLRSLHARIERMTMAEANALSGATVALLAACLGPYAAHEHTLAPALLFRIRQRIEADLASAELTVDDLARRFAISRASLYRLFEPLGGVATYIRRRRLHRAFAELTSSAQPRRLIGSIGYGLGFASESDFARAFRAAYGMTPSEVRGNPGAAWLRAEERSLGLSGEPDFVHWLREISR